MDTGLAGSAERIREALSALGSGPEDLKRILLTYQHDDHTGGLEGVRLLFAADAFGCLPRKIRVGVRKALCVDPPEARRSAEKLLGIDFSTAVMSHGPTLRSGAKGTLREVVARCRY